MSKPSLQDQIASLNSRAQKMEKNMQKEVKSEVKGEMKSEVKGEKVEKKEASIVNVQAKVSKIRLSVVTCIVTRGETFQVVDIIAGTDTRISQKTVSPEQIATLLEEGAVAFQTVKGAQEFASLVGSEGGEIVLKGDLLVNHKKGVEGLADIAKRVEAAKKAKEKAKAMQVLNQLQAGSTLTPEQIQALMALAK